MVSPYGFPSVSHAPILGEAMEESLALIQLAEELAIQVEDRAQNGRVQRGQPEIHRKTIGDRRKTIGKWNHLVISWFFLW